MLPNKIKKWASIALLSLYPFLLGVDGGLKSTSKKYVINNEIKYEGKKVTDFDKKISYWTFKDSNGNFIGDDPKERKLYSELAFSAEVDRALSPQINYLESTQKELEKILLDKTLFVDYPKFILENGSNIEGRLLNYAAFGATKLPVAAQTLLVTSTIDDYGKELLENYTDSINESKDKLGDILKSSKDTETKITEVSAFFKDEFGRNIDINLAIANQELKIAENLLKKDNRTLEENKLLMKCYKDGVSKTYAYTRLASNLINTDSWTNIGKKVVKNFGEGFTGNLESFMDIKLDMFLKEKDLEYAFVQLEVDKDKIKQNLATVESCWEISKEGSEANTALKLFKDDGYVGRLTGKPKQQITSPKESVKQENKQPIKILEQNLPTRPGDSDEEIARNSNPIQGEIKKEEPIKKPISIQINLERKSQREDFLFECPAVDFNWGNRGGYEFIFKGHMGVSDQRRINSCTGSDYCNTRQFTQPSDFISGFCSFAEEPGCKNTKMYNFKLFLGDNPAVETDNYLVIIKMLQDYFERNGYKLDWRYDL